MKSLCFILLLILMALPASAASRQPEAIRVAIVKGAEQVKLDGGGLLATDEQRLPLRLTFPAVVKRSKDLISVNGRNVSSLVVAAAGIVQVNGKGYRGLIEVYPGEKGLLVINELPLEEYLVGLINCEISSLWPIEAVKAQAVIARSYAFYQKDARKYALYHLESSVLDQVYEGVDIEDSRAVRGVRETAGEVLTFGGRVIQAFYHANCGGHTEAAENVWGTAIPYLCGVECAYCTTVPSVRWEQTLPLKKLESLLRGGGYQVSGLQDIRAGKSNASGRVRDLTLVASKGSQTISAVNFRKAIGYSVIKSTNFDIRTFGDDLLFTGFGSGHGVGLCQWGAKQRASEGFSYREILDYYYPGVRLERLYGS
ncbi:MAG TPA: SpoIID/LytB domain-containing protein [Geobacteraceae bacterium]